MTSPRDTACFPSTETRKPVSNKKRKGKERRGREDEIGKGKDEGKIERVV